jgi:hypothetical protein
MVNLITLSISNYTVSNNGMIIELGRIWKETATEYFPAHVWNENLS